MSSKIKISIPDKLYFRIGEVSDLADVKPYVLRFWESEFPMISPQKSATGQRIYRRGDVETILLIKHLLYQERYSIEGARNRIRELRSQGELKAAKKEMAGSDDSQRATATLKEISGLATDLKTAISQGSKLFAY